MIDMMEVHWIFIQLRIEESLDMDEYMPTPSIHANLVDIIKKEEGGEKNELQ